jgi:hypothetical protein
LFLKRNICEAFWLFFHRRFFLSHSEGFWPESQVVCCRVVGAILRVHVLVSCKATDGEGCCSC